jgi:glutamate-1-semialdehyde 2,1-aminomutase
MSSARIPNKVLAPICGRPVLDWIVDRLEKCKKVHRIALAVPMNDEDNILVQWAHKRSRTHEKKVYCTTGLADDVLDRVYQSAWENGASKVIRLTGDNVFLSYEGIDELVDSLDECTDYLNNRDGPRPYLDGAGAEIAWYDSVMRANRVVPRTGTWRQHAFIWMSQDCMFTKKYIESKHNIEDIIHLPLMIDEPHNLKVAELVMEEVVKSGDDSYPKLLEIVRQKKTAIERLWCEG